MIILVALNNKAPTGQWSVINLMLRINFNWGAIGKGMMKVFDFQLWCWLLEYNAKGKVQNKEMKHVSFVGLGGGSGQKNSSFFAKQI